MWKLWKTRQDPAVEERLRMIEAEVKALNLEQDKLFTYVRSQMGRFDKKTALNKEADSATLTPEEILRRAPRRFGT